MNIITNTIRILTLCFINYFFILNIYGRKTLNTKKLIAINGVFALFSIAIEFILPSNELKQFTLILYAIPLLVIYSKIIKEELYKSFFYIILLIAIILSASAICSIAIYYLSLTHIIIDKTILDSLYNLTILAIASVNIAITNKYIKRYESEIETAIKNISKADIIFKAIVLLVISTPYLVYSFNTKFKFNLLLEFGLLSILFLEKSYWRLYIHSQSKLIQAELYSKSLASEVDSLRIIKHDYNNILQAINGYLVTEQYDDLAKHMQNLVEESKKIYNNELISPKIINQPAVYGVIGAKYFEAMDKNIKFKISVNTDIKDIHFDFSDLSRILGILLDNAIEATEQTDSKELSIAFSYNKHKQADMIEIKNNIKQDVNIDLEKIFNKGESSKKVKSGLGLWEVKKLISSRANSQIYADVQNDVFCQTIIIEKS